MSNNKKDNIALKPNEAEFIQDIIIRNKEVIKSSIRPILKEHYNNISDDCFGEIQLLACNKIKELKAHEKPDAWIIVAAKKVAMNLARKEYTRLRKNSQETVYDMPSNKNNVFEEALYNIWIENGSIEKLLSVLTPHERDIYNMLYIKRITTKQVAASLNLSESTIRNINSIIKRKIKNAIKTELF